MALDHVFNRQDEIYSFYVDLLCDKFEWDRVIFYLLVDNHARTFATGTRKKKC